MDRPAVPMSRHSDGSKTYTKGVDDATHVHLKLDNPQGLHPRYHGAFPITKRLTPTTIEVKTGTFRNGTDRLEIHSWNNAKPAHMGEGAVAAERPALGRPSKQSTSSKSSPVVVDDTSGSEDGSSHTDKQNKAVEREENKQTVDRENSNRRSPRSTRNPSPNYVDSIFEVRPWAADKEEIKLLNSQIGSQEVIDLLTSQIGA